MPDWKRRYERLKARLHDMQAASLSDYQRNPLHELDLGYAQELDLMNKVIEQINIVEEIYP